jgi:meiotically up-regulated gene 157 (Mug157) protein
MNRRRFLLQSAVVTSALLYTKGSVLLGMDKQFPVVRVPVGKRNFTSKAVEQLIAEITAKMTDKELAWMFGNCFPNTLDTTVDHTVVSGKPDTYVITGDIDAMWLRDSSAQVWPYLPLCGKDDALRQLIAGVVYRQTKCILKDPYANAFYKDENKQSEWHKDNTTMQRGIHERKWEIDSLCYPIRLAHGYWKQTGDTTPFNDEWEAAMLLVLNTWRTQQRYDGKGPYSFMRMTEFATDSVPMGGYGYPVRPNGLICSMFRPSDDATIYPYLIPSNMFAVESMKQLHEMMVATGRTKGLPLLTELQQQVSKALADNAVVDTPNHGKIYAYEVNGYGSANMMDDANVPSLLSLSYLIPHVQQDKVYQRTRKYVLSADNPFFFSGKAGEGIGGPHVGVDSIWPLSIIMRGLTSTDDKEISLCLQMLKKTHAGTGFMHESFHKDDANRYTRSWFAWANTLFGELVWKVYKERPHLL